MNTRKYEALYIVPATMTDEEVDKVAENFKNIVERNGGTVESAGKWDKRKLAYEIDGHREGNYILMHFEAPAGVPAELNRLMRINDLVIRHRIFLREEAS
jgi:small subunit ribosomal protein S6